MIWWTCYGYVEGLQMFMVSDKRSKVMDHTLKVTCSKVSQTMLVEWCSYDVDQPPMVSC